MVWFVVIGEGRPARAVLDVIIAAPNATAEALVISDAERNPLAEFARRQALAMVDTRDLLGECRRLAGRSEGWLVSANSTIIIPREVLELFEGRSLNLHPGLLPEYAGLHTHQWALRNGEREFGVSVHRVEPQIDAGAIVGQVRFPISPDDTGLSLFTRCLTAGRELFSRIITQITRGEPLTDIPQDLARRRLYRHRDALDGRIDWNESAIRIIDFIRAGNYEPFTSPSYVARLDRMGGFDVEVLRATKEGVSTSCPGAVVDVSAAGPLIACGDGATIRIVKARHGREAMSTERWHEFISHVPGGQLLGRSETQA